MLCVGFQKVQKLSLLTNVCTPSAGRGEGKQEVGVVGGNFAKTFLNLNKRKFGAQSCLYPVPRLPPPVAKLPWHMCDAVQLF